MHEHREGGRDMSKTVLQSAELRSLLKSFKEQHGEEYDLRALGYFGSYARNEATPESDVGVVFETDRPDLPTERFFGRQGRPGSHGCYLHEEELNKLRGKATDSLPAMIGLLTPRPKRWFS